MHPAARRILPLPAKAVLNLWAGVEDITGNPTLKVPLTRMDHGLTRYGGMGSRQAGHLGMDAHLNGQDGLAQGHTATGRKPARYAVGPWGLGAACADALKVLRFQICGYSRSKTSRG